MGEHHRNPSVVVAVDIGTTHSGYSIQSTSDSAKDPLNKKQSLFLSEKDHKMHGKTASCLLLNPDKSFNSFGFTAEKEYCKMLQEHQNGEFKNEKYPDNKTPSDWYFFRHFKMNLHGKKDCDNDTTIKDETGNKELPLKTVFRESIGYLKEHALDFCTLTENDVLWVLTLPAIWSESQKEMMRSAAIEAGIQSESLIIALEPEAAALLTMEQELNRQEKNGKVELLPFASPSNLLMIDLGGGTVDTTILQSSEEIAVSTSWNFGGNKVNDAFMQIWSEILENDFTRCKDSFPNEVLDLWQNFEVQKRSIGENFCKEYLCVPVPEFCYEIPHFKDKFENSSKYPGIKVNRGKVEFPNELIEKLFMKTITEMICHVRGLLNEISVDAIILVGGFSESKFVYKSMKDAFKNVPILKPHEGSLAVLKGALLYGSQF